MLHAWKSYFWLTTLSLLKIDLIYVKCNVSFLIWFAPLLIFSYIFSCQNTFLYQKTSGFVHNFSKPFELYFSGLYDDLSLTNRVICSATFKRKKLTNARVSDKFQFKVAKWNIIIPVLGLLHFAQLSSFHGPKKEERHGTASCFTISIFF